MKDTNELIAEFMGYVYEDDRFFMEDSERVRLYEYLPHELRYHTSWDWLMPVVYKILWLENYEDESYEDINNGLTNALLSQTYDAVVEFIKQQNKNK